MIKNLIADRSDLQALIEDYYEREERKEFGRIERYGRLSFDEFMAECGAEVTELEGFGGLIKVSNADRLPFYDEIGEMTKRLDIEVIEDISD